MRYITILIGLILYWILIGMGTSFLAEDTLMSTADAASNASYSTIETGGINFSSIDSPDTNTLSKWKTSLGFLFGNTLSTRLGVPPLFTFIISFLNWFSIILALICIYKIGNPISSA